MEAIAMLKYHFKRAQDRMKYNADKKRTYKEYEVGQWVYVKLQPYRQMTLRQGAYSKLAPKFYGPFEIIARVGTVAYKLELPPTSQVHPVFHVSQLKLHKGTNPLSTGVMPQVDHTSMLAVVPLKILDRKLAKRGNADGVYWLIQWSGGSVEDATWEFAEELVRKFTDFDSIAKS
ncbi:uncharacterized protein [Rutidosis leptorrhynchoides]|uniref:uncharacterized protein n=1 Tax=Rutidosis leptorrhynchoides TaxID=125765 RepID=UPI003A9A2A5D